MFQAVEKAYSEVSEDFRYIYVCILLIYIPTVTVSSLLVIATVLFKSKLSIPHNYIIMCLSLVDLSLALVLMPFNILRMIPFSNCVMLRNSYLCLAYDFFAIWIQVSQLYILFYMNIDKLLMVKLPLMYKENMRKRYVFYSISGIISAEGLFVLIPLLLNISTYQCNDSIPHWLIVLLIGKIAILVILGLITGIILAIMVKNYQGKWQGVAVQIILFYNFTVLFLPSEIYLQFTNEPSITIYESLRLVRYLQPVTNGAVLALMRPAFKNAFLLLLTTNPLRWRATLRACSENESRTTCVFTTSGMIDPRKSSIIVSFPNIIEDENKLSLSNKTTEDTGESSQGPAEMERRKSISKTPRNSFTT